MRYCPICARGGDDDSPLDNQDVVDGVLVEYCKRSHTFVIETEEEGE